jgi:ubiquinone/menaquinone biosynthesis C-methylase UbiE
MPSDRPKQLDETARTVARHWDTIHQRKRVRWWHKRTIIEEINRRICGKPLPRISQGAIELAREIAGDQTFSRGVSVGGGSGSKEMLLLDSGLVEHMTIFELSGKRIEAGRKAAEKRGLADRIEFIQQDAFSAGIADNSFDLVHWNNALHHMMDVNAALGWSRRVLRKNGLFFMDDYVGPNRFQWSGKSLQVASRIRQSLPERYLTRADDPDQQVPMNIKRPNPQRIIREDPSEAPDSARIMACLERHFPGATVVKTGGLVYNLALTHTLHHFSDDDEIDRVMMRNLMLADELVLDIPGVDNHYAVAIALAGQSRLRVALKRGRSLAGRAKRFSRRLAGAVLRRVGLAGRVKKWLEPEPEKPRQEPVARKDDSTARHFCPMCKHGFDKFVRGGHYGRSESKCPVCGSLERHRAAWLYFEDNPPWRTGSDHKLKLLHIAPEAPMERCFQELGGIDYLSADIEPGRAMVTMDLTDIDRPDDQFDLIFCSHVLEHIVDDQKAMQELCRVVRKNGRVFLQVPLKGEETYEDFSITGPEARKAAFGQEDHVRMYGKDILKRLETAGFDARIVKPDTRLSKEERVRMNTGGRPLIVCTPRQ